MTSTAAQPTDQLQWEARFSRPAAAAAVGSALCTAAAYVLNITAFTDAPDGDRGALITIDDKAGTLWAATALRDLGIVLLACVLYYLLRVTQHRQRLPGLIAPLIPLVPLLLVSASILGQADIASLASEFTESSNQSEKRAEAVFDERSALGPALGAGGTLALALALVLLSLNAMRVGILSRFMGVIGIVTGALLILPLAPGPIIQVFWLGALAALFLDRWPGGRGPAWETGEAVPWPSAAALREQSVGDAVRKRLEPSADEPSNDEPAEPPPPSDHPVSKKRKRKRRR